MDWAPVGLSSGDRMFVGTLVDYEQQEFKVVVSPYAESWRWEVVTSPRGTGPASGVVPTMEQALQAAEDWVEERRAR